MLSGRRGDAGGSRLDGEPCEGLFDADERIAFPQAGDSCSHHGVDDRRTARMTVQDHAGRAAAGASELLHLVLTVLAAVFAEGVGDRPVRQRGSTARSLHETTKHDGQALVLLAVTGKFQHSRTVEAKLNTTALDAERGGRRARSSDGRRRVPDRIIPRQQDGQREDRQHREAPADRDAQDDRRPQQRSAPGRETGEQQRLSQDHQPGQHDQHIGPRRDRHAEPDGSKPDDVARQRAEPPGPNPA